MPTREDSVYLPSQIHNHKILQYYKDVSDMVLGSACGILQLEGLYGLIFFVVGTILTGSLYQFEMTTFGRKGNEKIRLDDYYQHPIKEIYLGELGRQFATFVMMWCLLGAIVSY